MVSGLVTTHVGSPFQAYMMANHQTAAMGKHFISCTSTIVVFVLIIVEACIRLVTSVSIAPVLQAIVRKQQLANRYTMLHIASNEEFVIIICVHASSSIVAGDKMSWSFKRNYSVNNCHMKTFTYKLPHI